jgi:isopropylmalate/homocitrate/citramalate synthase
MTAPAEIEILDTTLREGEQCYGIFFPIEIKKQLALVLNKIGVNFIEVGHPAAAPSIKEAVSEIVKLNLQSKIIAHARLCNDEIRLVKDLGLRWVGLFCGINDRSQRKYNATKQAILKKVDNAVSCAKALGLSIKFTCEDASRTEITDLVEFYGHLAALGVERLSYADTIGIMRPHDIERLRTLISPRLPFDLLHFHFHNDFGFANRNAIKAMECGARCIDTSVLGIGERMGLVSLEFILSVLNRKNDTDDKAGNNNDASAGEAVKLVESCINYEHFKNRQFAHKSGIHIHGIIKDSANYEPTAPGFNGPRRVLVLSKLIGRSGLQLLLSRCGFKNDGKNLQFMLEQVKSEDTLELSDLEDIRMYFIGKGVEKQAV